MFRPLGIACLLLGMATACAHGQQARVRLEVPTAEALDEAKKLVAEVYKPAVDAAKTPAARASVAKKILQAGDETNDDPNAKFALLLIARKLASQSGDIDLAYVIADATAHHFRVTSAALKAQSLADMANALRAPTDHYFYCRHADRLWPELRNAAAWDEAAQLANLAEASAKKQGDADLVTLWTDRKAEIAELKEAFTADLPALAELENSPTDAVLNQRAGQLNCFLLEAWKTGIPMLALGSDLETQQAAEAELRSAASAADKLALADAWYAVAKAQTGPAQQAVYRHAYASYRDALAALQGLAKAKVQSRANECFMQGMPDRFLLTTLAPVAIEQVYREGNESYVKTVSVAGQNYRDSLWGHPPNNGESHIIYELPGDVKYITGKCAIRDKPNDTGCSPLQFRIVGSKGELWRASSTLQQTKKALSFKVDLKGQTRIELVVGCKGANFAAHACWIEPMLQK